MKDLWYFVKWQRWGQDENTWKAREGMKNGQEEVARFHRENSEMAGLQEVESHKTGFPSVDSDK